MRLLSKITKLTIVKGINSKKTAHSQFFYWVRGV